MPLKNPVESLSSRKAAASRPAALARSSVLGIDEGAGRVAASAAAAVGSIRIRRKRMDPRRALQIHGECESIFLVGTAAAFAAQRNGQLAAGKHRRATALRDDLASKLRMLAGNFASLALEAVA